MTKNFKNLAERERKALLLATINKEVEGCLSKEQLETIVNSLKMDIDVHYKVTVVKTAKELTGMAMLKEYFVHGSEEKEEGNVIFGKLTFGEDYYNDENGIVELKEPEFPIEESLAFSKVKYVSDRYRDEEEHEIVVYLPKKEPFEMDPILQYILNNFKIN